MAYSDYGAFVYLNGERRTVRTDAARTLCGASLRYCPECGAEVVVDDE